MKRKIIILVLIISLLILAKPISTNLKVLLLISQEFPQIPIKPLQIITRTPSHQKVDLSSSHGKIIADLFLPDQSGKPKPAIIFAMGVKTQEADRPVVLGFADTLSRLGYVVLWPRLEILDQGTSLPEEPETFIQSFNFLEKHKSVDPKRISFVGFSVGSSIAFIAAQDVQIREKVRALVFYGGYFDIFDYLLNLATKNIIVGGKSVPWQPAEGAISHAQEILKAKNAPNLLEIFEKPHEAQTILNSIPQDQIENLKKLNPAENVENIKTSLFILHDLQDPFVPFTQSQKLNGSLKNKNNTFLLVSLFEHVQPKKTFDWNMVGEFLKLYGFLYRTLSFF